MAVIAVAAALDDKAQIVLACEVDGCNDIGRPPNWFAQYISGRCPPGAAPPIGTTKTPSRRRFRPWRAASAASAA